jgi:CRISPR-associated endonuclease/helicase Cas3
MPAYAHLWSQTAPIPNADPDVALFLHGPDRSPASVQIVWRADIDEQHDLRPAMGEGADAETARNRLVELLKLVPPRAAEAIEVPLWATRAWLDQPRAAQASFSDAADRPEPESDAGPVTARRAFLWAGEGGARTGPVYGRALRDGDLIVVPVGYGGCDPWGWKPASTAPVNDVADKAAWPYRARRFAVRVTPELARLELLRKESDDGNLDAGTLPERLGKILADHRDESPQRLLEAILALGLPPEIARRLDMLSDPRRRARKGRPGRLEARFVYGDVAGTPRGVVFIAPFGIDTTAAIADLSAAPSTESEDAGAAAPEPLGLAAHAEHVRAWASAFVAAGLTAPMAEDVAVAALLHDAGKADRRYQAYYAGGDPYGQASEPLAKTGERRLPRGAWERAGLPPRWRHEALSVRLARGHRELQLAHDPLLVLWLIGTHHGYGRPLFPHADPTEDREPGPQSLAFDLDGLDWVRIFDVLKEKYGIWGLARLEAFVRLADHRASEAGAPPGEIGEHREAAE